MRWRFGAADSRERVCARDAWWALLGGPATSPLEVHVRERTPGESEDLPV